MDDTLVDRLAAAAVSARAAEQELRQTIREYRLVRREADEHFARLKQDLADVVTAEASKVLTDQLREVTPEIKELLQRLEQSVIAQFDLTMNLLIYGNKRGVGESIFERVRTAVEANAGLVGVQAYPRTLRLPDFKGPWSNVIDDQN